MFSSRKSTTAEPVTPFSKVRHTIREMLRETRLAMGVIQLYRNWPIAFLERLHLLQPRPVVYRLRNGIELCAHTQTRDLFIMNENFLNQVYTCSPGFAIRDGWIIADVGGHKGIFAVFAATRARDVVVYTFEPSRENFSFLSHNIQRNRLSNVRAFNVAVSGKDGELTLHLHREPAQNTFLQRPDAVPIGDARVESWSLEHVLKTIASPLSLLKMDIEGMEYEALLSCPTEALQRVERIALEYHDGWVHTPNHVSDLVDFLSSRGFSTRLIPDRKILVAERQTAGLLVTVAQLRSRSLGYSSNASS